MTSPELTAKPIDVAVGILIAKNGDVLLGQRPPGKPFEGYWEFPGGKVEAKETSEECLKREIIEELGIKIRIVERLKSKCYNYENISINLLCCKTSFRVNLYTFTP